MTQMSNNIYALPGADVRCPAHGAMWVHPSRAYLCGCAMPYQEWKRHMEASKKRRQKTRPTTDRRSPQ